MARTVVVGFEALDVIARALGDVTAQELAIPTARELLDIWYDVSHAEAPRGETLHLSENLEVRDVVGTSEGAAGEIVSPEHYSGWVNFGTARQAPRPFFTMGAAAVLHRLAEVEQNLERRLSRQLAA